MQDRAARTSKRCPTASVLRRLESGADRKEATAMRTPAQIAGHPIHPMLVTIPIGLWIFSLVCDFVALRSDAPGSWEIASFYALVGGILGALAAAIPGLIDLMSLRDRPVFSTALTHMGLN